MAKYVRSYSHVLKGFIEKDVKLKWPMPFAFDRFKNFGHDDLTGKHYFGCSRPPDVDEIKIFDKDDQAAKHNIKKIIVLWPGYLYQMF